jgi:hypothetical protein
MDRLEILRQERIKKTEDNLRLSGAEKCIKCNLWQGVEYLKDNVCCDCRDIKTKSEVV